MPLVLSSLLIRLEPHSPVATRVTRVVVFSWP